MDLRRSGLLAWSMIALVFLIQPGDCAAGSPGSG